MKAIYIEKPGELGIKEVPPTGPEEGEARVKIKGIGVCAGDVSAYLGYNVTIRYPRILGHEAVGEVMEVKGTSRLQTGDRVAVEPFLPCGQCRACRLGKFNNCERLKVLGVHIDGAMREVLIHPISHLIPIPEQLDWELATLAEPMAIAVHAITRAKVYKGQYVAISGAGAIGMLCAIVSRDLGANPIILDPISEKLELARKLGFKDTINAMDPDCVEQVLSATGGAGADAVLECSGAQPAINNALKYIANSGYLIIVGWPKGTVDIDLAKCIVKELHIDGSRNSYGEFPKAMDIICRNKQAARALVTNVHSFDRIPDAIKDMVQNPQNYIKLLTTLE